MDNARSDCNLEKPILSRSFEKPRGKPLLVPSCSSRIYHWEYVFQKDLRTQQVTSTMRYFKQFGDCYHSQGDLGPRRLVADPRCMII